MKNKNEKKTTSDKINWVCTSGSGRFKKGDFLSSEEAAKEKNIDLTNFVRTKLCL